MGSSRTRGALDNLQRSSVSDSGCDGVGVQGRGSLGNNTRGRGHCQGGHRAALLAC